MHISLFAESVLLFGGSARRHPRGRRARVEDTYSTLTVTTITITITTITITIITITIIITVL